MLWRNDQDNKKFYFDMKSLKREGEKYSFVVLKTFEEI